MDDGAQRADTQDADFGGGAAAATGRNRPGDGRGGLVVAVLLIALAAAWTATAVLAAVAALAGRQVNIAVIASWVSVATGPLALIGVVALLWRRSLRVARARLARVAHALGEDGAALDAMLDRLAGQAAQHRASLAASLADGDAIGRDLSARVEAIEALMRDGSAGLHDAAARLDAAGESARVDLGVLLADMPAAEAAAQRAGDAIRATGEASRAELALLEARVDALAARARDVEATLGGAAAAFAARLAELDAAGEAVDRRIRDTAALVQARVEAGLAGTAEAFDRTRAGIDAQSAALVTLVEESEALLGRTGSDAAARLTRQLGEAHGHVDRIAQAIDGQDAALQAVIARLVSALGEIEARSIALTDSGVARSTTLGDSLAGVRGEIERLSGALAAGDLAAQAMTGRAEWLRAGLDNAVTVLEQRLPIAFDRIEAEAEHSRGVAEASLAPIAELEARAEATRSAIAAIGANLAVQADAAAARLDPVQARIEALRDEAAALVASVGDAADTTAAIADETGPRLVEAMTRAREAGMLAADRTRAALADIVPASAAALAEAARQALADSLPVAVERHMAALAEAAARAGETARAANEALVRQLLTLTQTTVTVEQRIADAREEALARDRDALSRRVALLIESLNSIAIDVTKVLSNDVTDSAWDSYLKGDRGVFTRRAVRLLDAGEVREIVRHYESEAEFREHVNRYVHDFEAMLREVLANRDGSPLGVTLLSSDMGKLYVALAQAIERLRA